MKIWLLTNDYPPLYGFGIGRYIENAAQMYTAAGHEVTIFVRDEHENSQEIVDEIKRVVRYREATEALPANLNLFLKNSYKLAEVVMDQISQAGSPDIIEVQDCMALGYYLLQRKKQGEPLLQNVPIVVHAHGPRYELVVANNMPEYNLVDLQIGLYEKIVYGLADGVVTPSQYLAEKIQEFVSVPVKVIPLPFELPAKYQQASLLPETDLLYIGRLERRKGVLEFVAEIAKFWAQGKKITLTIVGADTYLGELKKGMKEFLIASYYQPYKDGLFRIIDQVPPDLVYILMQRSRLVVLPSFYDNFPVSVLESMALGLPVLISSSGGQREIVNEPEKNGFVFDWNKENDLTDKIEHVLSLSNEVLKVIGENGKCRIAEICNHKNNLEKRISYFQQLLKDNKPKIRANAAGLLSIIFTVDQVNADTHRVVENVLAGSYQDFELLIFLYGNAGKSEFNFSKNDKIKIINSLQNNETLARNEALAKAQGQYITFLSDNEYIDKDYYGKCVNVLSDDEQIAFVYSWLKYFSEYQQKELALFDMDYPLNLLPEFFMGNNNAVYRREVYLSYGAPDINLAPELDVFESWLRLYQNGYKGVCLPDVLTAKKLSDKEFNEQGLNYQDVLKFEKMLDKHKSFFEENGLELLKLNFANI